MGHFKFYDGGLTDWFPGDFHLLSDSPGIDMGNPGCSLGDEPVDQNNIRINMGHYGGTSEATLSTENWAILADITNDHRVDIEDFVVFVQYWLDEGRCLPSDLNRSEEVDLADYAALAADWLKETYPIYP